jgi:hypothetical protein
MYMKLLYFFKKNQILFQLTLMDAKQYCEGLGMQLLTFQNLNEANLVAEHLVRLYITSGSEYCK